MDFKQKSQLYKLYVKIQVIKNDIYLTNSRKTPPVQLFHMLEGKNIEIYMGSPTKLKLMERPDRVGQCCQCCQSRTKSPTTELLFTI
jgi:hypothetical protein